MRRVALFAGVCVAILVVTPFLPRGRGQLGLAIAFGVVAAATAFIVLEWAVPWMRDE